MSEFFFTVPPCEKGSTFRLTAPDKKVLQLPMPPEVLPGDQIHLIKNSEDNWVFKNIVRPGPPQKKSAEDVEKDLNGPDVVKVRLDTTKGQIVLKLVPSWSPNGVRRMLELVDDGFFKDLAIYRGVPNFLIQFGIANPNRKKAYTMIPDDALAGVPYLEGTVGFAAAGPNTRTQQLCLFLGAQPGLGQNSVETPIGRASAESLPVLRALKLLGDIPQCGGSGPDPTKLADLGNEYIAKSFPGCDFITGAARI
mmetsp:Transcript_110699/g.264000  ORF Transcript_110699/g.264000 Transcript_110699/m.264000 type:complete len:252 (+) Transcript_110699:52-807(+)|eukprot:CAMPEP_0181445710 /NCGR_PEP_ID=MMETSP1110-20121109/25727_1 /TAXON_ID=174948 /ORGANISM="Symbiodinium sp., Strain CCMP421" /LENGTH=251 /DNA_ID=CAMNT_0023569761 /DNA_START=27 /DNA_END=782 /DNA_ORIENTATION=-